MAVAATATPDTETPAEGTPEEVRLREIKLNLKAIDKIGLEAINTAISHPLRTTILHLLKSFTEMSPKGIVDAMDELGDPAPLGNVSYHVRTLAERKLIKITKKVQRRGALEHYYVLTPLGMKTLERIGI